jgi:protein-S-isoprenylcysteine O-methyltransferase Ste14
MTNDLSTRTTRVRNLAGAALTAVILLMTLTELALGETAGTNHEVGANARIWGLVLVVVAAAGLVICALAVHRSQR